jgi:hypothetical protein
MEGLRTLVIAQRLLTDAQYEEFKRRYSMAKSSMENREMLI